MEDSALQQIDAGLFLLIIKLNKKKVFYYASFISAIYRRSAAWLYLANPE
jgi:hypothetical protein